MWITKLEGIIKTCRERHWIETRDIKLGGGVAYQIMLWARVYSAGSPIQLSVVNENYSTYRGKLSWNLRELRATRNKVPRPSRG